MAIDPFTPVAALVRRIRSGDLSPVDVVGTYLDRIDERNDRTNAFVTVLGDPARDRAREAERAVEAGADLGPLHGVPVAVKDLTPVAGVRTTYGSVPLADHVPEADDPVVERLRDAGAIVLGKTNTSEFGHLATTDNPLFGATGTPFDPDRTAGGSSGGSAAAVADGLAPVAQGTDAGGSVRIPAAACGVFGFKPSFGRVPNDSRPDAFVDAHPFVHAGPIARTVEDAALVLDAIAGPHPRDPFSLPPNRGRYVDAADRDVGSLDVAYSPDMAAFPIDDRVRDVVDDAVEALAAVGTVERADPALEFWDEAQDASRTIFQARMAQLGAHSGETFGVDLTEHADELTPSLATMMEIGREHTAVDLGRASATRTAVFDAVQELFADYDLLATPTLAVPPFDTDLVGPDEIDGEPVDRYTGWYLTQPFNMTGHPAASIPAGFTDDGLPVGLQIVGRRFADGQVLGASAAFERERRWDGAYPP